MELMIGTVEGTPRAEETRNEEMVGADEAVGVENGVGDPVSLSGDVMEIVTDSELVDRTVVVMGIEAR